MRKRRRNFLVHQLIAFKASTDEISPITIRNLFCTAPAVRNLPRNFFVELFDTCIFISSILAISEIKTPGIVPIGVGLLVWAIGMGLGGPTGFAMNLARDMGPRIAHAILPIANKGSNCRLVYAWIFWN